jgi:hypothetical protein
MFVPVYIAAWYAQQGFFSRGHVVLTCAGSAYACEKEQRRTARLHHKHKQIAFGARNLLMSHKLYAAVSTRLFDPSVVLKTSTGLHRNLDGKHALTPVGPFIPALEPHTAQLSETCTQRPPACAATGSPSAEICCDRQCGTTADSTSTETPLGLANLADLAQLSGKLHLLPPLLLESPFSTEPTCSV